MDTRLQLAAAATTALAVCVGCPGDATDDNGGLGGTSGADGSAGSSSGGSGAGGSGATGGSAGTGATAGNAGQGGSGAAGGSGGSSGSGGGSTSEPAMVFVSIDDNRQATLDLVRRDGTVETLNGNLAMDSFGVGRFELSPDRQHVIYPSDEGMGQVNQLRVVPVGGGTAMAISQVDPMAQFGSIRFDYAWASTGDRIAYQGELDDTSGVRLYTVKPDGTEHAEIAANVPTSSARGEGFKFAPDGMRLAYASDSDNNGEQELWAAFVDGSNAARLMLNLEITAKMAGRFRWTADSSRVVYRDNAGVHSIKPDGTGATMLSTGAAKTFKPSPTGASVAWVDDSGGAPELYISAADGSGKQKLAGTASGFIDDSYSFSPDGSMIAYRMSADGSGNDFALYTIKPDGSDMTKVSADLKVDTGLITQTFTWSPDSSRLAFFSRTGSMRAIHSAPADGSSMPAKISLDLSIDDVKFEYLNPLGEAELISPQFTQDSDCIVYFSEEERPGRPEMFAVKADGSDGCANAAGDRKVDTMMGAPVDAQYANLDAATGALFVLLAGVDVADPQQLGMWTQAGAFELLTVTGMKEGRLR